MRILRHWEEWGSEPAVAAVGNFDGVHLAHRQLLEAARDQAAATGAASLAVTFEPHPGRILQPQSAPALITPLPEKIRCIAAAGVEALLLLPFTRDLSLLSPREFVERILVRGLRVRALHEGENFRLGHRQAGTVATLAELGAEFGFEVYLHPQVRVRGEVVSSSRIRALVAAGAVERARHLLGRPFALAGPIAPGRGVGRQRTVPTLNLQHYEELVPGRGVYLTAARLGDRRFAALTNVGVRPTFGEGAPLSIETYLLHPPEDGIAAALGDELRITFLRRLRDERRFDSPELLRAQIQSDIGIAATYFRRIGLR